MFSTFTGNSRRPRNVNLSGSTGNPFANTSWSPSAVSNATNTVTNAQADREKRQAERNRLKAAAKIQRTWRGHRERRILREHRRSEFDKLYSPSSFVRPDRRRIFAPSLLLSFFSPRRNDDVQRLICYARDADSVEVHEAIPLDPGDPLVRRLVKTLIEGLDCAISLQEILPESHLILKFLARIAASSSEIILPSLNRYYTVLADLCKLQNLTDDWPNLILQALSAPLAVKSDEQEATIYQAYAFSFLASAQLRFFEQNIDTFSSAVSENALASTILKGYSSGLASSKSKDDLLWLLAHFIDLSRLKLNGSHNSIYLEALHSQLVALLSEISLRVSITPLSDASLPSDPPKDALGQPTDPYISSRLALLVEHDGIQQLLQTFSSSQSEPLSQGPRGTGLLSGYILILLRCFPNNGDDIRMRLFLEQISTSSGEVPTIKYLWQMMRKTAIFRKLGTESESPVNILQRYLVSDPRISSNAVEEQEWRTILLFLELYIFVLRLSDDEDFFSGIYPQVLQSNSSTSRIRACSLSLEDVGALTSFLKNTAFPLHYKAQEFSKSREAIDAASRYRMQSYSSELTQKGRQTTAAVAHTGTTTRLDLDSLRAIVTTAMKMLYERDSRKQFLPPNHWLMSQKLDMEGFVAAVIAEEERQSLEDSEESDEEGEDTIGDNYDFDSGFYSTMSGQRLSRHVRMERFKAQQMKVMRERRLAEMGPKLEILKHMPFVVPFEARVKIFRRFIELDRMRRQSSPSFLQPYGRQPAPIRRQSIFEDAYSQFYQLGEGLKDTVPIAFIDQFGEQEAGIDGGGVTKEFLISITSEAFGGQSTSGGLGMFTSSEKGLLYPNPIAIDADRESLREDGIEETDPKWKLKMTSRLKRFEFLGRIVGKCMYEGILVDLNFAGFFLLKWASAGPNEENKYKGSVNDLRDMDEGLYNGMLHLKNYAGDISELGIDFTITDQISSPGEPIKTTTRKLIANGDQVFVTNDNRLLYISYVARHRLVVQPSLQTAAFLRGLRAIIRPSWLSMFNQSELQRLVGGDSSEIDIDDLRNNTIYSGLYQIGDDGQEHPTIKLFWKVMRGFTDEQRREVLKYVSSTPRAPLLGFSQLSPKFSIRDGGADEERLPSTSTCVNLLKLPLYNRESTLREKLLYAVTSGAGFDLS